MSFIDDDDVLNGTLGTDISDTESISNLQYHGVTQFPIGDGPLPITSSLPSARLGSSGGIPSRLYSSPGGSNSSSSTGARSRSQVFQHHQIHGTPSSVSTSSAMSTISSNTGPTGSINGNISHSISTLTPKQSTAPLLAKIASLESELREKARELRETQNDAKATKAALELQIMDLQTGKRSQSQKYQEELLSQISELKRQHITDEAELVRARETIHQLQNTNPDISNQLSALKQSLHDVIVSEAVYHEYKSRHPETLTLREAVCVLVYELHQSSKAKIESLMQEGAILRDENQHLKIDMDRLIQDKIFQVKSAERKAADYQERLKELEQQLESQSRMIAENRERNRENEEKIRRFDIVASRLEETKRELEDVKNTSAEREGAWKVGIEERKIARERINELEQEVAILKLDKVSIY